MVGTLLAARERPARQRTRWVWLAVFLTVLGCSPTGQPPAAVPGGPAPGESGVSKRIRAAFMSDPPSLNNSINQSVAGGKTYAGVRELESLLNGGLTLADGRGGVHPQLVEAVPSVENGLWTVFPDGR